jgi:hypothetical protein
MLSPFVEFSAEAQSLKGHGLDLKGTNTSFVLSDNPSVILGHAGETAGGSPSQITHSVSKDETSRW